MELQNYERCEHVHGCENQGAKRSPDTLSLHNGNGIRKKVGVLAYKPVLYRSYICVPGTWGPLAQANPMLRMLFYLYIGRTESVGNVLQVGGTRTVLGTSASGRMSHIVSRACHRACHGDRVRVTKGTRATPFVHRTQVGDDALGMVTVHDIASWSDNPSVHCSSLFNGGRYSPSLASGSNTANFISIEITRTFETVTSL